jgi:predicted glycogen debranching enzyme
MKQESRRFQRWECQELSANQYPGVIHPQGHLYLKQFRLDPSPVFTYEVAGIEIEKSVFMIHGENSAVIQYELKTAEQPAPASCILEARPLIAFRDYHSLTHENGALNPRVETELNLATVRPYDGAPTPHLAHNADELDLNGWWYRNFEYQVERERGLDFQEDLFSPWALKFDLGSRSRAATIASTERRDINRVFDYRRAEIDRREAILAVFPEANELVRTLAAADQYVVARGTKRRSSPAITGSATGGATRWSRCQG